MPTLSHVMLIFETFIIQWEHLSMQAPQCAPFIEAGLSYTREYYLCMGKMDAYAIAMCKTSMS